MTYERNGTEAFNRGVKGFKVALEQYTTALWLGSKDMKANAVIHSNRAQVSLGMKEYERALEDAIEVQGWLNRGGSFKLTL